MVAKMFATLVARAIARHLALAAAPAASPSLCCQMYSEKGEGQPQGSGLMVVDTDEAWRC